MKVIQKINNKLLYILPGAVILGFMALGIVQKIGAESVKAVGNTTTTFFGVQSELELGLSIPQSTILSIAPTAGGTFNSDNLDITVSTNYVLGYTLQMNAYIPNTTTATTSLTRTVPLSDGTYPEIGTLASGSNYTATEFANDTTSATMNKWGYSSDGTNFKPVTATTMLNSAGTQGTHEENVTFGAKLDNELPNGTYGVTLQFVLTAIPPTASNVNSDFETAFAYAGADKHNGYYKMQDMTSTICSTVYTPGSKTDAYVKSAQLIDARDEKIYWVTKLMDGKCWMTQNLDLNLGSVALNSTNTNISASTAANATAGYTVSNGVVTWTPKNNTIDSTGYGSITTCSSQDSAGTGCWGQTNQNFAPGWLNDNDAPYSDDPGYRYVSPKMMAAANTNWFDNGDTYYNCATQSTSCDGNGHYTMGNFYNFAAATATNSVNATLGHAAADSDKDTVMPNSICPKGWRLPIDKTTNNEFNTLLGSSNYDVTSNFNFAGLNAVRSNPLYFVRSGYVNGGSLNGAGVSSYTWSSTVSTSANGFNLSFYSTGIDPAHSNDRLSGFAVRCLAE